LNVSEHPACEGVMRAEARRSGRLGRSAMKTLFQEAEKHLTKRTGPIRIITGPLAVSARP
jgi:hypothetical protein